jgi:hypothetical protein
MPGIGKSQLVLHYAKVSFKSRYSYIFWMSAASVDKLTQGFANILDSVCHPDRYLKEQNAKLKAAQLWLEDSPGDWLIIIDNVDSSTLDFLRTYLPRQNARGNILFTMRRADLAETLVTMAGNQHSILPLGSMELHDSANLLLKDAGFDMGRVTHSMLRHAEDLVKCVGRLPLAVVQAAACMKQTDTTLDQMLEWYKSAQKIEVSSSALR